MIRPIVTNIDELRKPCKIVESGDPIKEICQDLKDTILAHPTAIGLSANQIGYPYRISIIRLPSTNKDKKVEFKEYYIINAKYVEKISPMKLEGESCISFPGLAVTTRRYLFCMINFLNEKLVEQNMFVQDLESFVVQHELSHQQNKVMMDDRWIDPNRRRK